MITITRILETKIIKTQYGDKAKQTVELSNGVTADYWGSDLQEGQEVDATVVPARDSKYNPTLKINKDAPRTSKNAPATKEIEKVMETKNTNIRLAQERSNDNMVEAANWRDAVMIVNTLLAGKILIEGMELFDHNEMNKIVKKSITDWHDWFANQKDPTNKPPFE